MATGFIRYADDAANTGPREATRTFTEDGVLKHLPRVQVQDNRVRTGVYYLHSGPMTVLASAHAAGAGVFWLVNHTAVSTLLAVRRVRFTSQHNTALATPTGPRILVERFTTTTNPSGTAVTAAKRRASDATPANWSARTTNTGLTQTAGAVVGAFFPTAAITAVGLGVPVVDEWEPITTDDTLVLAAGEGIRIYQPDAGTAADTRRYFFDMVVEEFTEF